MTNIMTLTEKNTTRTKRRRMSPKKKRRTILKTSLKSLRPRRTLRKMTTRIPRSRRILSPVTTVDLILLTLQRTRTKTMGLRRLKRRMATQRRSYLMRREGTS
jgi:hypothetical protein